MSKSNLSSEERIKLIEDKLAKPEIEKPKPIFCPFCSPRKDSEGKPYFDSLYEDIFCNAYQRIENKTIQACPDPKKCPHNEFLLDDAWETINFIKKAINRIRPLRNWDGIHLSDVDPDFPEDIIQILADKDKMEFVLLWHEYYEKRGLTQFYSEYTKNKPEPALYEHYLSLVRRKDKTGQSMLDSLLQFRPDNAGNQTHYSSSSFGAGRLNNISTSFSGSSSFNRHQASATLKTQGQMLSATDNRPVFLEILFIIKT